MTNLGGRVTTDLAVVDGFAARLPADAVAALRATPGVTGVTADATMSVQATSNDSSSAPSSVFARSVRADDLWAAGNTGQGLS